MKKNILYILLSVFIFSGISWAQIAAWQFGNPASAGNEATYNATTNDANLNTAVLSRGSGITATALGRGFAANAWDASATKATAVSNNEYYQFTLNAKSGYKVSLSTLDYTVRRSGATAPNAMIWKYSIDGTTFTEIGSDISYTGTTEGVAQTQISLSGISALQNVTSSTTITFRLYAWGGTSATATFSIGRYGTGITTNSLAIGGSVGTAISTPTTQAHDITFPTIQSNQLGASWTNGDGTGRLVKVNTSNSFTAPTDGTSPSAATAYSGGEQVVLNGTGNSVTVTTLSPGTTYYFRVYEYNGTGATTKYLTTTGTNNPNSQATLAATGSSSSDIIANASFVTPTNIAYGSYQETSLTSSSLEVAEFTIRDGAGSADADNYATTLTGISFSVANSSVLREVGIFDGTTKVAEVAAGSTLTFNGLSLAAADGGSKTFSLRASFASSVTDNTQFSFTVTSATANASGSLFASANAGGAVSSTTGNANKIAVVATKLVYTTNKPPTSVNVNLNFNVEVSAVDNNNNLDLDAVNSVALSIGSGTGVLSSATGLTQNLVSGVYSWTDVQYNTVGSFTITATASPLTSATSSSITASSNIANHVVIAEIYGGGGNSGATYTNDYVVLFNPTASDVSLNGYSIQYASATGAFTGLGNLTGTIPAGGYYGILMATGGSNGVAVPFTAGNTFSGINMSGTTGKVALANNTTAVTSPTGSNVVDYVGFGTATAFEGSGPAPAPSVSTSIRRKNNQGGNTYGTEGNAYGTLGNGWDTNDNANDFYVATLSSSPAPLPVELTTFSASTSGRGVLLKWNTATEVNSAKFVVERKSANDWYAISSVNASGNSSSPKSYSFIDKNLVTGKYLYRLKMVDNDGSFEYSSTVEATISVPSEFSLSQNYPNPFNPSTEINFDLPSVSQVKLELYSVTGSKVATVINSVMNAGYNTVRINMNNYKLSSGTYFYKMSMTETATGKTFTQTRKLVYMK
jgi:hypothetical protein